MKKILSLIITLIILFSPLSGCSKKEKNNITVLSREEGSGTRTAFEELLDIEETIITAEVSDSTFVMTTTVVGNRYAIGYISLGSLNESVKALKVDGTPPTSENVKSGEYKIARPFIIATGAGLSDTARDFISFILSKEGQSIAEENKYIAAVSGGEYKSSYKSGKITVTGSSSVAPVMEKLKEAYISLNPEVTIELQQSDSTNGINSVLGGICDIGMASRELKKSEKAAGLTSTTIALDGIAVIINKDNPIDGISLSQLKDIYTGKSTLWSEILS